jgi:hypothetical protein
MGKFFCKAGPVNPSDHYCLPLYQRLNEQNMRSLIEQKKYFILHAPRQTGKTSTMLNLAKILNAEGKYTALYVNVEGGQAARSNFIEGNRIILDEFLSHIEDQRPDQEKIIAYLTQNINKKNISGSSLKSMLQFWAKNSSKPLVIFIDEIDALVGDTLISVLRQLRAGYANRPQAFPQSVCLIGVRDVRDYRIWSDVEHQIILGGSAFNIKDESLRLADFNKEDVCNLYQQHTTATDQKFDSDAIEYAFELTQGQPWLVNALAYQACFVDITDRNKPITKGVVEQAKETLILRRDTHLDVLVDRLQEPRVRNIIDAIIRGTERPLDASIDDIQYVIDLGLVKKQGKDLVIANPLYQEVLPRELTYVTQLTLPQQTTWYQKPNGLLDVHKLLDEFARFYRENSKIWLEQFTYKEAGPHLLLMAFLQRIINGGGKIHREYALGRGRVDLLVEWKNQKFVIELKVYKDKNTLPEGLMQTSGYMDASGATEGHLVIFDRSTTKSWEEKIYMRQEQVDNKTITVWGM